MLLQLEMMRRAEEIKQQNAHVKENLNAKPKPASRKRRDAERAAAKAQQQVRMHVRTDWTGPKVLIKDTGSANQVKISRQARIWAMKSRLNPEMELILLVSQMG